jgi:putative ABC transport system substrate-binding protein
MAVRILNGEEEPADMPIEYLNEYDFSINTETAEELGIEIPAELAEKNTFGK